MTLVYRQAAAHGAIERIDKEVILTHKNYPKNFLKIQCDIGWIEFYAIQLESIVLLKFIHTCSIQVTRAL